MTTKQIENAIKKIEALETQKKALDNAITELKTAVQGTMGDEETITAGRYIVRWTRFERPQFETKRFAAEHARLFKKYTTITKARRFSFSEK